MEYRELAVAFSHIKLKSGNKAKNHYNIKDPAKVKF